MRGERREERGERREERGEGEGEGREGREERGERGERGEREPTPRLTLVFFLLQPPIVPKLSHAGDTRNFDDYPEENWRAAPPLNPKLLESFKGF